MDSIHYEADGSSTETTEESGKSYESCPDNTVTVTVCDTGGRPLTIQRNSRRNGRPYIISTVFYYNFEHGRVTRDSSVMTGSGHMYSLKSRRVKNIKYDARGNRIETNEHGGGQYAENYRRTFSYNEQNMLTDSARYNSCVTNIPEKEWKFIYDDSGVNVRETVEITPADEGRDDYFYDANERLYKNTEPFGNGGKIAVYEYQDW